MSRKVRDYLELVSAQWDVMRKNFYGEEVREAVLDAIHVSPSDTVLDVGAGTGFLTEAAAKIAAKVIALDFSRGMSEEAIAKMGSGNVEFQRREHATPGVICRCCNRQYGPASLSSS